MSARVSSVSFLRLPMIKHPLTKLGDPETLALTGCSTERSGNQNSLTRRDRLMEEDGKSLHSAFRSQSSGVQSLRLEKAERADSFTLPACIPEGVEVILSTDRDTPKFPIFGKPLTCQPRIKVCRDHLKTNVIVFFSLFTLLLHFGTTNSACCLTA